MSSRRSTRFASCRDGMVLRIRLSGCRKDGYVFCCCGLAQEGCFIATSGTLTIGNCADIRGHDDDDDDDDEGGGATAATAITVTSSCGFCSCRYCILLLSMATNHW